MKLEYRIPGYWITASLTRAKETCKKYGVTHFTAAAYMGTIEVGVHVKPDSKESKKDIETRIRVEYIDITRR